MKDPNAPRGNCQAFFYFAKKYRAKLGEEMGDKNPAVVSKELGRLWRELPDEQKLEYLKMAGEDRKRYERELMIYESSGQAKAWQHQEQMEKERMREVERRQQLLQATTMEEDHALAQKESSFIQQLPAFLEQISTTHGQGPCTSQSMDPDCSPLKYVFPTNVMSGEGANIQDSEAAVNEAVTAGTPPCFRVDKQWSGPGSSQRIINQGQPNRKVRYSPYSPYAKQRKISLAGHFKEREISLAGHVKAMDPRQQGSWSVKDQNQLPFPSSDWGSSQEVYQLPTIKDTGNDSLAAITRQFGINDELDCSQDFLDKSSLAQGFLDQSQEFYEEVCEMQPQGEQIPNQEQQAEETVFLSL